ncbi:MAG TPA: hypothetical protein VJ697_12900 [Nitrososphaeraceae archaeon]|nr:hypothetical protein [Nitrososphaeraceae archaeon]
MLNQHFINIVFWSEKRIDACSDISIDNNTLLRIIRNDGKEVYKRILDPSIDSQ